MNHLTALAITITAFSSGLYGIYKFFRAKYISYDTKPIHYWLDKPTKIKKRYKTFRKHKLNKPNKLTKITKISILNNRSKSQLSYAKYGKLNKHSASIKY
jgi:hypothetical protein